jgi:hypothetical protein
MKGVSTVDLSAGILVPLGTGITRDDWSTGMPDVAHVPNGTDLFLDRRSSSWF